MNLGEFMLASGSSLDFTGLGIQWGFGGNPLGFLESLGLELVEV